MTNTMETLKGTDWPLLRRQKHYLLDMQALEDSELLDGLINFLYALQDAAVADGIETEHEVFGRPV